MPVKARKQGSSWVVTDARGKVHGRHQTKGKAEAQARAINASMHSKKRQGRR